MLDSSYDALREPNRDNPILRGGLFLFQIETQRFNQMQVCTAVGTKSNDVAGIRRDFWFV